MSAFSSPQCPSLFSFSTPFWAMRLSSSLRMGMGVSTFGSTSKNSALWVLTPLSHECSYSQLVLLPSELLLHGSGSFFVPGEM